MADKKIPGLSGLSDPKADDLLLIVDDAADNPVNKKIQVGNLFANQAFTNSTLTTFSSVQTKQKTKVRKNINLRNEATIEEPEAIIVTGLNDISSAGNFDFANTGTTSTQFDIEIDRVANNTHPDAFKWREDGGSYNTEVDITQADQTLSQGVTIKFTSNTGHSLGDKWRVVAYDPSKIVFSPGNVLQEDSNTNSLDFSSAGSLILENDEQLSLEQTELAVTANSSSVYTIGPFTVRDDLILGYETIAAYGNSADGTPGHSVSTNSPVTFLTSTANTATLTMAAGVAGQVKQIIMTTAGNAMTMTRANGNLDATAVPTSIVFDAVGETVTLLYSGSKWFPIASRGATIS